MRIVHQHPTLGAVYLTRCRPSWQFSPRRADAKRFTDRQSAESAIAAINAARPDMLLSIES